MKKRLAILVCLILGSSPAISQPPSEDWRTLEIPGFRFHTPVESEPWTRYVAERMGSIQEKVEAEVGFSPEETVDVLVIDPIGRANGSAWSILGHPRMLLYTTPPATDSVLGHFDDWSAILALHETVHLTHLLRPSRNPREAILQRLIPIGPLVKKTPKWIREGYATLLEGRLTGWGRPHGDDRAALLRRWAQMGRLPSYGALSGSARRWRGGSFPYLVGSAYLEWLTERAGEDSLKKLWARLSARENRSFDAAFRGVFGDSPSKLYHRFTAELTFKAMTLEASRAGVLQQGELWQDLDWQTGPPTISPDGERIAVVIRKRGVPSRLAVWSTADDAQALEEREARQKQILEQDPEDVAAVLDGPLPRKPLFELPAHHGAGPREPRFSADGESILFVRYGPASSSATFPEASVPDLFRWWPESGHVERVTQDAGIRRPDPAPDGSWAVAVRHPHGLSELVQVNLQSGVVEPLLDRRPSIDRVLDHPRLSPNGERLLYLAQHDGAWKIVVRHLASGTERRLPTPGRARVMHPTWASDDSVLATVGMDGFLEIHQFDVTLGGRRQITRSHGAALAAAPSSDGSLFFLAMEADGLDIRRLRLSGVGAAPSLASWSRKDLDFGSLVPAVRRPIPKDTSQLSPESLEISSNPYGIGPREYFPLLGGGWNVEGGRFEFGLRQGDPVGRVELLLLGAVSDRGAGTEGAGLALRWNGSPVGLGARVFSTRELFSNRDPMGDEKTGFDEDTGSWIEHEGFEISLHKSRRAHRVSWSTEFGALWDRVELGAGENAEELSRKIIYARGAVQWRQSWGSWRLGERLAGSLEGGETEGDGWSRYGYDVAIQAGREPVDGLPWRFGLTRRRGESDGVHRKIDQFQLGGQPGSLLPSAVKAQWQIPALPSESLLGDAAESQRVELEVGSFPMTLFWERHRAWSPTTERRWLRLAGVEWTLNQPPMPLLRLPGIDLTFGVGHLLDAPFKDRTEGWIGLRWQP